MQDRRLVRFVCRSRFAFLAAETKRAYTKDYRLFFSFLHRRGKHWNEADHEDIDDYESWRRRSADNPRRIGGSKWARELAAFKLLYGWAAGAGHTAGSPVRTHTVRRRDGTSVEVGKFLTPKQADALFDEPEFNIYDNPAAFLTCNNDPAKALCHPERTRPRIERTRPPSIDRCNPACANVARTDTHIQRLRTEIENLTEEATSPLTPTPLRERLSQRITALQRIADRHEQTKIVPAHPERPQ